MQCLPFLTSLQAVCKCIPPTQSVDFLRAILDSPLHVTTAPKTSMIWKWVFVILKECGKDILAEVKRSFFHWYFLLLAVALHPVWSKVLGWSWTVCEGSRHCFHFECLCSGPAGQGNRCTEPSFLLLFYSGARIPEHPVHLQAEGHSQVFCVRCSVSPCHLSS